MVHHAFNLLNRLRVLHPWLSAAAEVLGPHLHHRGGLASIVDTTLWILLMSVYLVLIECYDYRCYCHHIRVHVF